MIITNLKLILRSFLKNRYYTLINILGLSIGLASFILIYQYVDHQMNYDRFPPQSEDIYRLTRFIERNGTNVATLTADYAPILEDNLPEIELIGRVSATNGKAAITVYRETYNESRVFYAEPEILDLFGYSFSAGDPNQALINPNTVILTDKISQKYFGDENPLGKSIILHTLEGGDISRTLTVTGVLNTQDINSHFEFDLLISFKTLGDVGVDHGFKGYGWTYLRLNENSDPDVFEKKAMDVISNTSFSSKAQLLMSNVALNLQPLHDIHLHSDMNGEIQPNGNILYIYIFSLIGLITLLISCINFINLTTALSSHKGKEIGVRKTLGAFRLHLFIRFLGEIFIITLFALITALFLTEISLPYFNDLTGLSLSISYGSILITLLLILIFVTLISGLYPASILSSIKPIQALKGSIKGRGDKRLWKALTVFQFSLSITLIICSLIIYQQTQYMQNKNLGYEKDQLAFITMEDVELRQQANGLLRQLESLPGVIDVSMSMDDPTDLKLGNPEEMNVEGKKLSAHYLFVDYNFIETLKINLNAGRSFDRERSTDDNATVIINKALADEMGWEQPLGKSLPSFFSDKEMEVIGVTENFHYATLSEKILPAVMIIEPSMFNTILLRLETDNVNQTISSMNQIWNDIVPYRPFELMFVDDKFASIYRKEVVMGTLFSIFTFIALLIACVGLIGISTHYASNKKKEIGIRKVFGAGYLELSVFLVKGFLIPVLTGFLIAIPISYLATGYWLNEFVYKIEREPMIFILGGLLALLLAIISVSRQVTRVIKINPAVSLRNE